MVGRRAVVLVVVCGWSLVACHGRSAESQGFDADVGAETDAETSTDVARLDTAPDAAPFDGVEEASGAEETKDVPGEVPAVEEVADAPNDDAPEAPPETVLDAADEGEVGQDAADAIDVATCVPDDPPDEVCDGRDNDCDGAVDEGFPDSDLDGDLDCFDLDDDGDGDPDETDCAPRKAAVHHGAADLCNGLDDDCDGATDEEYEPLETACGVGACLATGSTACLGGVVVDSCEPFGGELLDVVCNGQDDDCDGLADDDYVVTATSCGVGACAAVGQKTCVGGVETDSCQALAPAVDPSTGLGVDDTCNGVDDDCDGATDEDFHSSGDVLCGPCDDTAILECKGGAVRIRCPSAPWDEHACNGRDDDCDGQTDEDYVALPTACGVGACQAEGTTTCVHGVEGDSCQQLGGAAIDLVCNGVDDDCDGVADDDFVPSATSCGVGACAAMGQKACVGGVEIDSCAPGTPFDEICNGQDDDCDGTLPADELDPDGDGITTCVDDCPGVANPAQADADADGLGDACDGCTGDDPACAANEACTVRHGADPCQCIGGVGFPGESDTPITVVTLSTPYAVAVGDVTGDGRADMVVTNRADSSVSVFVSRGGGAFATRVDYATGGVPYALALSDVTGDGKADLVVANNGDDSVSVLANRGDGTFAAKQDFATGEGPYAVAVGDVTGDGNLDVVVANRVANTVSVLVNLGDGSFAARTDYAVGSNPLGVAIADVTGDGSADLAVANYDSNSVSVLANQGNGVFAPRTDYSTSDPSSVAVGDVTGDGKADLVVTNGHQASISVLANSGSGTFATAKSYPAGGGPSTVVIADLSGDGLADLVVGSALDDTVNTLVNRGGGTFTTWVEHPVAGGAFRVALGDVTGDGQIDLVVASPDTATVSVLRNLGGGSFTRRVDLAINPYPGSIGLGDVTGDGLPDLVVPYPYNTAPTILVNLGVGAFAPKGDLPNDTGYSGVALGDLTGDGVADLVATNSNFSGDRVGVLLNQGDGTFASKVDYEIDGKAQAVAIGDLTGDGLADLAVSNYDNSVGVLVNQGGGMFGAIVLFPVGYPPSGVAIGDVTGDGAADLAVATSVNKAVNVLVNQGGGVFSPKVVYPVGVMPSSVAITDVTGDGNTDLVVASDIAGTVSVLANRGDGTFGPRVDHAIGSVWFALTVADVTGDGVPDLVVSHSTAHKLSILANRGNGTFAAAVDYATGRSPTGVAVGDLDGDGKPDLAVANGSSRSVSVRLQTCQPLPECTDDSNPCTDDGYVPDLNPLRRGACHTPNAHAEPCYDGALATLGVGPCHGGVKVCSNGVFGTCQGQQVPVADMSCDGADQDCDGQDDDEYVPVLSSCGVGACEATGHWICVDGAPVDSCVAGQPAVDDATCDAVDDDCDGEADDGYVSVATECGVGACLAVGETACVLGVELDSCVAGAPAANDATCDAIDDDCNGETDEDTCVIDGTCHADGAADPASPLCRICSAEIDATAWTAVPDGTACDGSGTCQAGACRCGGALGLGLPTGRVREISTGFAQMKLAAGDLNGDGAVDLVASRDNPASSLSVHINKGDGYFEDEVHYEPTGRYLDDVEIGDVNGDGALDIVTLDYLFWGVGIYLNRGDGTFDSYVDYIDTWYQVWSLALGDLDGDGDLDLAVTMPSMHQVRVLLNAGDGTFVIGGDYATGSKPDSIAIGDLDGDGRKDLAVADAAVPAINVLRNQGAGKFSAFFTIATGPTPRAVTIRDLDGDGAADLLWANEGAHNVSVLWNDGAAGLTSRLDLETGNAPWSLAIGDLDGDGHADLVVANEGDSSVSVFRANGHRTFAGRADQGVGYHPLSVLIDDLTGDGEPDLGVGVAGTPITVLVNAGNGTFAGRTDYPVGASPEAVVVGDVNGDGRPDVLEANSATPSIGTLLTAQDGSLVSGVSIGLDSQPGVVALGDLDGDDRPDLVVGSSTMVGLFLGLGDGTFADRIALEAGLSPRYVAVGDLDGDGRPDVIAASDTSADTDKVAVLWNDGDGTFAPWSRGWVSAHVTAITAFDVNGDGRPDLLATDASGDAIGVFLNNGDRTFAAPTAFGTGASPCAVATGDFDDDERPDLVVANFWAKSVSVLRNEGDGTFAPRVDYTTDVYPAAVAVADLNGDGRSDLQTVNRYSGTVSVRLNRGDGSFGALLTYGAGGRPAGLAVSDLDNDGRVDLVVTNFGSDTVSVLPNTCLPAPNCDDSSPCTANDRWDPIDQACVREPANDGGVCGDGGHCGAGACLEPLTVTTTGPGTIVSGIGGIDCGATCAADVGLGRQVTLYANRDVGGCFTGWGGDCSGTGACVVIMGGPRSVKATFVIPSPETCNLVDDDCDSQTDEALTATTACGLGACAAVGQRTCMNGVEYDSCQPGEPAADDATCDGVDDDCDGATDEGYAAVPTSTTCGIGPCVATGTLVCVAGAETDVCEPGPAGVEICNGLDDDCDGAIDEGFCAAGQVCVDDACRVPCGTDADCAGMPPGVVGTCAPETGQCAFGFVDGSEVLTALQDIYQGAVLYRERADRLTDTGHPVACSFPASQDITPIEGTCLSWRGGPDRDDDGQCDWDPFAWNSETWMDLGFTLNPVTYPVVGGDQYPLPHEQHSFLYAFTASESGGWFQADASIDVASSMCSDNVFVRGTVPATDACEVAPPTVASAVLGAAPRWLQGQFTSCNGGGYTTTRYPTPIDLTPLQRQAFLPAPGVVSKNPFWAEVSGNLQAILEGAVGVYEAGSPGACAFPVSQALTPVDGTCCCYQTYPGPPDADCDLLCDADLTRWQSPGWQAVGFSIPGDHAFVYGYETLPGPVFRAEAWGDLDCDTIQSTFYRFARPIDDPSACRAEIVPGMFTEWENE